MDEGKGKGKGKAKATAKAKPQQQQQQQQQQAPRRSTRIRKPVEKLDAASRVPAAPAGTTAARKGKAKAKATATANGTARGRGRPKKKTTVQARVSAQLGSFSFFPRIRDIIDN